ncbi:hypothetical protein [Allofournierella sp.]|uniref:hypothetical protein n=1 Tax=Allofournierella sp. TaxID=1940256 RepID=UPI003AB5C701
MSNLEHYRSAMAKVTPGEGWKAATLAKMAEAQKEPGEAGQPCTRNPRALRWRKAALPLAAAAAFALVAVPAALRSGLLNPGATAGDPQLAAANDCAPAAGSPETGSPEAAPRVSGGTAKTDGSGFDLGRVDGRPVLVWGGTGSGGMGSEVVYLAKTAGELKTANPTYNLPQERLPAELPVFYAQSGRQGGSSLQDMLQKAADFLNLPLQADDPGPAPTGYPTPQLWPYSSTGRLVNADLWQDQLPAAEQPAGSALWRLSASGTALTLQNLAAGASGEAQFSNPAAARQADDAALAQFAGLAGLQVSAYQAPILSYTYAGEAVYEWFTHFYYEAGSGAGTISQKLLDYSFKRVYGSLDASGQLDLARLTLPPAAGVVATYPLRTLSEAKAALDARLDAELQNGRRDYALSSGDLVAWELEYDQDPMNPYIQPVYVFTLKTPLTPEEAHYDAFPGSDRYTCYVKYKVSALPEEYCVPWAEHFN